MTQLGYTTCMLCEAACGIEVEHDGEKILSIRGDKADVHSRGYICPKAAAIADVQHDPDRVRQPLRKTADGRWEPIGWDEALELAATRIGAIQREHGRDAVAYYTGNPTGHSSGAIMYSIALLQVLGTKSYFSAQSVDALPRLLASYLMYGSQATLPVPDVDRTDFLLILGANPLVSNGSVMSAPFMKKRIKDLQARGGKLVVIDPRRSETAAIADVHYAVRPGGDALLLAAMLATIFAEGLARPGRLEGMLKGLPELRAAVKSFTPSRVADAVGIDAAAIAQLARDFAAAPRATCYGRMGVCTQSFGTLASLLIDALNTVTGNLDRIGGAMFSTPAIDLGGVAAALGQTGSFDRWRSRVSGLPEFNGELPVAAMAEEMETPGAGQVRALITHAGNPVLSTPDGRRLERAIAGLDFMVAIDIYVNETTRHADLILPPTWGLEHEHYPLLALGLAVRNATKYGHALTSHPSGTRHDWEILLELSMRILATRGPLARAGSHALRKLLGGGPRPVLALATRLGPHGLRGRGLTLEGIEREVHGIDLGALEPRLPGILRTRDKRIDLFPALIAADVTRLEAELERRQGGGLQLVSRRHARSNNSWMHNSQRLTKGPARCTLLIHPSDASSRNIADGQSVQVRSEVGAIEVTAAVSDEMMPGVVCLPHGWGHHRDGAQLQVAAASPGASINDLTSTRTIDAVSGCSSFAIDVEVAVAVA
jgi:anaerobic selenocysteine-containing dehydrogenase